MCGLAGFLRAEGGAPRDGDPALLCRMAGLICHRGPDDEGVWAADGGIGFAHRRLAVIDLTPDGHQPMFDSSGRYAIVFNGEIYNFRELRAELEAAGDSFRTHSDTEILLAGYRRWGEAVLPRLNGMFAFAIWDAQDRTLFLARDRLGKKPLFYAQAAGDFLFGSEVKSILVWPGLTPAPDYEAIHHYLTLQYVPSPWSAFRGVKKLPPGACMTVRAGRAPEPKIWWRLPRQDARSVKSEAELCAELRDLLGAAVRRRMISDVPLGAFLSGGVDSSAVVAFMAQASSSPVKTFCIGFDEARYDERAYARIVAEKFRTEHHEEIVRPDAADLLPKLAWHYGEPFADPSAIPTYYVSRLARRDVTVALSGDGGDELFIGYGRYGDALNMGWANRLPEPLRRGAALAAAAIPGRLEGVRPFGGVKRRLKFASGKGSRRYEPLIMYFFDSDKPDAYGPALAPYLSGSTLDLIEPYFAESAEMASGAALADIHTYLPDDILVKVDIASMAHGLETRAPFLDVELVEWAARLPLETRLANNGLKGLLKKALEPMLPHEILYRKKMGFGVPVEEWLRTDLRDMMHDLLLSDRALSRGLFNPAYVRRIAGEHVRGERLHHTRLWAMLVLELWFRTWIDAPEQALAA